jgi:hypothetical protein
VTEIPERTQNPVAQRPKTQGPQGASGDPPAREQGPITGKLRSRLQLAGMLVAVGLLLEAITLVWSHPFSFMTFIFFSGSLVAAGAGLYLWTVVSHAPGE